MSEAPKDPELTGEAASEAAATTEKEREAVKPEAPAAEVEAKPTEAVEKQSEAAKPEAQAAEVDAKPTEAVDTASATTSADKPARPRAQLSEEEKAAKVKAAQEARAAREKAAAGGTATDAPAAGAAAERPARVPRAAKAEEPAEPKAPSPKQPLLDKLVADLQAAIAPDAIEGAVINEYNDHLPTLTVKSEHWLAVAQWLRDEPEWSCNYLRNLSGVDLSTEMEVVYHLIGLSTKQEVAVRVKTNREQPSIASVTPLWPTANWNEREVYDLLGIDFPGHPDLRRIMMPDDWVGHPLRKDYEPLDSEV